MSRKYIVHKAVEVSKVRKANRPSDRDLTHNYLCQPKYDGCNMVAFKRAQCVDPDKLDGHVELRSRTDEKVHSARHIEQALACAPFLPAGVYLGEYWHPELEQSVVSGYFRDTKQQHPEPYFVIFDYLTQEEFDAGHSELSYAERVGRLPDLFFHMEEFRSPIFPAEGQGYLVDQGMTPNEAATLFSSNGRYDGIILRRPDGTWTKGATGTTGEIIKIKPLVSLDLRVVGFEPGRGKYEGMIGTLLVEYKGKAQGAGTGLKDSQRLVSEFEEMWHGQIVEIECLGITRDGYLREPRLKGIRHDKTEPDT